MNEREKIINAARRLAMADGLYNLSVKEIAEAAEISEETFYKFFIDIDEVIRELMLTRGGIADEDVLKLPIEEKIRKFNFALLMQVETAGVEKFAKWIHENIQKRSNLLLLSDKEIVRKIIVSSVESGELSSDIPVNEIVEFIASLNYGMGINWCMTNTKFEPLEHLDTFNDLIINALIPYLTK